MPVAICIIQALTEKTNLLYPETNNRRLQMDEKEKNYRIKLSMTVLALLKFPHENLPQEYFPASSIPFYLNEKQASFITGMAIPTLRNDRFLNRGISYCKISRSVRYGLQDVIDFMETQKINPGVR